MPLRGVMYFARLYKDFVDINEYNLYGTAKIPLPFPQYVIFYNGTAERPEREVLRLSDSFQLPDCLDSVFSEPALECRALMLNINYGKNQELLKKCKPLLDYSRFVYCIRQNLAQGFPLEKSVDTAIEFCLKEDILSDVLRVHRKEVIRMFLEAADDERYWQLTLRDLSEKSRKEGWQKGLEEGHKEGRREGLEEGRREGHREGRREGHREGRKEGRKESRRRLNHLNEYLLRDNRMEDLRRSLTDPVFQESLLKEYGL